MTNIEILRLIKTFSKLSVLTKHNYPFFMIAMNIWRIFAKNATPAVTVCYLHKNTPFKTSSMYCKNCARRRCKYQKFKQIEKTTAKPCYGATLGSLLWTAIRQLTANTSQTDDGGGGITTLPG